MKKKIDTFIENLPAGEFSFEEAVLILLDKILDELKK